MVFTCVAHALTHACLLVYTPLDKLMAADFGLTPARITFYFALCNVFFGLGAVPSGWLSDRFGEKALLVAFFFGCGIGSTIVGLAPNLGVLTAGFVVLGLATSIFHPVGNALITKGVKARGRALGINGVFGSLGTAAGPFIGGVIAARLSWNAAFLALAVPSAVLGVWLWMTDLGPAARRVVAPERGPGAPRDDRTARRPRLSRPKLALFVLLLTAMTCGGFYFHLFTKALPFQFVPDGESEKAASSGGSLAGLALVFGAIGQYYAGTFSDRFEERGLYIVVLFVVVPLLLAVAVTSGPMLIVTAGAASLFMSAVQPIENSILARFSPTRLRGRVFGLKFILTFGVGGLGTWAAGVVEERYGLPQVFQLGAAVAFFALVAAVIARFVPVPRESGASES